MMGISVPETCWSNKSCKNCILVASSRFFTFTTSLIFPPRHNITYTFTVVLVVFVCELVTFHYFFISHAT
jgi:hypothetical protein